MSYTPGTCNIGKAEIRQRQVVALIGLAFAVASLAGLLAADAPRISRAGLFLPLMVFSVGMVQARRRFCLAYGFAGTFNFGRLGKIERVDDSAFRKADRAMAVKVFAQSVAIAALLTLITFLLP